MAFKNHREWQRMQRLIDATAKHGAAYHKAQNELMELCRDKYGAEPGDVDADEIIDSVLGGCGEHNSIPAERFDEIMSGLTNQNEEA